MAAYENVYFVVLCIIVSCAVVSCDPSRKLFTHLNYQCNVTECKTGINGSFANLVYVQAVGQHDVLHYAMSTIGVPSVVVIRTKPNPQNVLEVNWNTLISGNINGSITMKFPHEILYKYAVVFTKLLEYNDTKDMADLNQYKTWNSTEHVVRAFTDFHWMEVRPMKGESNAFVFNSTVWDMHDDEDVFGKSAPRNYTPSLSFIFRLFDTTSREKLLPHLLYNDNITQFDFTLDNFTPSFSMSRFALEFAIFSKGKAPEKITIDEKESIDDEYTPGVFRVSDILMNSADQKAAGFLQWKPVCYKDTRQHSVATKVMSYDLVGIQNDTNILRTSIAYAHFGQNLFQPSVVSSVATNLSFGMAKDGFYIKTNYTSWTASIGYGNPPADKVSLLVIGVIAAGLGIPIVISVVGIIFMLVKRRRQNHYRLLQDVNPSYPQVNS